jgi:hypothetical protein
MNASRLVLALVLCLVPPLAPAAPAGGDAARETEIDGLQLLGSSQDRRLATLGVKIAYVETDTRPGGGQYVCGGIDRNAVLSAASAVAEALQYLPDAAFARLNLRYVVLCGYASAGGQSIGGIPVPPLNLLMLDAGANAGNLVHTTLHELYHLFEYRIGSFSDSGWSGQFDGYSNSYPTLLRRSPIGGGRAGFINSYAETHPHEERAELFAFLMLSPGAVAAQAKADPVLRRKAEYLADKCERQLGVPISLPR